MILEALTEVGGELALCAALYVGLPYAIWRLLR